MAQAVAVSQPLFQMYVINKSKMANSKKNAKKKTFEKRKKKLLKADANKSFEILNFLTFQKKKFEGGKCRNSMSPLASIIQKSFFLSPLRRQKVMSP